MFVSHYVGLRAFGSQRPNFNKKITFTVSQPILLSSMCGFNSVSCWIAKVPNMTCPCTNNLLFYLVQNSALNIFPNCGWYVPLLSHLIATNACLLSEPLSDLPITTPNPKFLTSIRTHCNICS